MILLANDVVITGTCESPGSTHWAGCDCHERAWEERLAEAGSVLVAWGRSEAQLASQVPVIKAARKWLTAKLALDGPNGDLGIFGIFYDAEDALEYAIRALDEKGE